MTNSDSSGHESFTTELGRGREGFLAHVIAKGLELGERAPDDFIRHFSPSAIMLALAERPMERARILVEATGIKERIALKKDAAGSGSDLQIALDEGVTTCAEIVRLFSADDKVRYLPADKLWAYATESEFWARPAKERDALERARTLTAFILDCAIENLLVSHAQVVEAVTVERLTRDLPKEELGKIIAAALVGGEKFTEVALLAAVPLATLVKHVSPSYIWERVVRPLVAEAHGYLPKEDEPPVVDSLGGSVRPAADESAENASPKG